MKSNRKGLTPILMAVVLVFAIVGIYAVYKYFTTGLLFPFLQPVEKPSDVAGFEIKCAKLINGVLTPVECVWKPSLGVASQFSVKPKGGLSIITGPQGLLEGPDALLFVSKITNNGDRLLNSFQINARSNVGNTDKSGDFYKHFNHSTVLDTTDLLGNPPKMGPLASTTSGRWNAGGGGVCDTLETLRIGGGVLSEVIAGGQCYIPISPALFSPYETHCASGCMFSQKINATYEYPVGTIRSDLQITKTITLTIKGNPVFNFTIDLTYS